MCFYFIWKSSLLTALTIKNKCFLSPVCLLINLNKAQAFVFTLSSRIPVTAGHSELVFHNMGDYRLFQHLCLYCRHLLPSIQKPKDFWLSGIGLKKGWAMRNWPKSACVTEIAFPPKRLFLCSAPNARMIHGLLFQLVWFAITKGKPSKLWIVNRGHWNGNAVQLSVRLWAGKSIIISTVSHGGFTPKINLVQADQNELFQGSTIQGSIQPDYPSLLWTYLEKSKLPLPTKYSRIRVLLTTMVVRGVVLWQQCVKEDV